MDASNGDMDASNGDRRWNSSAMWEQHSMNAWTLSCISKMHVGMHVFLYFIYIAIRWWEIPASPIPWAQARWPCLLGSRWSSRAISVTPSNWTPHSSTSARWGLKIFRSQRTLNYRVGSLARSIRRNSPNLCVTCEKLCTQNPIAMYSSMI